MFDTIRNHQRALQFVLLLLILPAFVFFGVSGYESFLGNDDRLATVGDRRVSRREYEQAVREQADRLREAFGGKVEAALLDTPQMRAQVLDGLIAQATLDAYAARERVVVPDEALRRAIAEQPGLRKPDGSFDMERYRTLLAAQGRTEAGFEADLRQDLARRAVPEALGSSALVPAAVARLVASALGETRDVALLRLRPADFAAQAKPTDEQLRKLHQDEPAAFTTPESAKVAWVAMNAEALARQVTLSEDDVRGYYEQNQARYGAPERRRASHVLVKVAEGAPEAQVAAARAKAEGLVGQLKGASAERFAEAAREQSDDAGSKAAGGDLDWFTRDGMVKPFADAVFAAERPGVLPAPVRSEFGFHVIRVAGIEAARAKPFAEVRPQIEAELRRQQGARRYSEAAEAFSNLVYEQSDSLEPVAKRFGLEIRTADAVGRQGPAKADDAPALANPRLLNALFADDAVRNHRNTEAVEVAPGTLVAARVLEHRPAKLRPFEEVRDQVRAAWVERESRRLAAEAGAARLKALQGGDAAAAAGAAFAAPVSISRGEQRNTLPGPIAVAALAAPTAKLPLYVGAELGDQGYAIARIDAVHAADDAKLKARAAEIAPQIARAYGEQGIAGWLQATQARIGVERAKGAPVAAPAAGEGKSQAPAAR